MSRTYDTIIIGAGSVGTPLAWQLSEAGQKVLVLDPNASVGQGSNKHAIGGVRATHSDPAKIRISLKSIEIFSRWKERYGDDIAWMPSGYAFIAYREREEKILKDLLVIQKSYGLNIDWYDQDGLLQLIPALDPEGLIGGTFSPDDGSASPMLSALAFERQAKECGADFHYHEPVTEMIRWNDCIEGVVTPEREYRSNLVINASGAWAADIAKMAGVDVPVNPDSHEAGITEAVATFKCPMVVDIRPVQAVDGTPGSANYYFYQHHTGQVIFCITPNPNIWGSDRRETSVFLPQVTQRMIGIMPRLKNLKVRRTWRGLYPMTPDGSPIVGEVEGLKGYFLAVGMSGQGLMLGPGLAYYIRHKIVRDSLKDAALANDILAPLTLYRNFGKTETLK
jgi:sarcosine oxidase subunit beta